jgi:hypothetical protein
MKGRGNTPRPTVPPARATSANHLTFAKPREEWASSRGVRACTRALCAHSFTA